MKQILILLLFISSFTQAQFSVNGTLKSSLETDWVILYKIEGARQKFIQNTTLKKDSVLIDGEKQEISTFKFDLLQDTKKGTYRISYKTDGTGFLDFIFNNENVRVAFHPEYPEQTAIFYESEENIIYREYLNEILPAQQKLDSLQITALQQPNKNLSSNYASLLSGILQIQSKYITETEGMYVQPFIKATLRTNSDEIKTSAKEYMTTISSTFFDHMDFSNQALKSSAFLINRITDFVFYINYSENPEVQQNIYKKSIQTVFSKIDDDAFKSEVIEFLIAQFETTKNLEIIDFLFEEYYDKLPEIHQNTTFASEKKSLFASEIGRIAPDFSWIENGKTLKLLSLKEAKNYVLVFWSTTCSHCLREIPELHKLTSNNKDVKVIAFSLEDDKYGWESYKENLHGWHNVLGLKKWQNKTARTYNIHSTPSYFILDANKKIIAKPADLEDLKLFIEGVSEK